MTPWGWAIVVGVIVPMALLGFITGLRAELLEHREAEQKLLAELLANPPKFPKLRGDH